ncbi:response regulator transcription factor [Streptomyces sp. NPDC088253]|uniref:response regulator transcription factor n=1 Tax=Streptomyces sp. NPDC088253 TaxID=3365846 RepID=UPI00382832BF
MVRTAPGAWPSSTPSAPPPERPWAAGLPGARPPAQQPAPVPGFRSPLGWVAAHPATGHRRARRRRARLRRIRRGGLLRCCPSNRSFDRRLGPGRRLPPRPGAFRSRRPLCPSDSRPATPLVSPEPIRRAAADLGLSPNTIGTHVRSIFAKLGFYSRVQLADALHRRGAELSGRSPAPPVTPD